MRQQLTLFFSLLFVLIQVTALAQPDKMITNRDNYFWQFGLAWTTTDDDGQELNPMPFDQLHGLPFPSRLYVDRYIYNGWSAEAVLGAQTYKPEKTVNDSIGVNGFIGYFDAALKYSFYKQLGRGAIDPYLGAGLGFSLRSADPKQSAPLLSPTVNLSAGCTFWLSKQIGLQAQGVYKFGLVDILGSSSYAQYSVGLVYRIEKTDGYKSDFHKPKYKLPRKPSRIKIEKSTDES
ncbi:MAG: hypothetical protein EAZ48_04600 [Flavobacteriia bacterium]|jgi:hypothetical protein|nr:MAG: hypothetical protein EAZ48_04600 [Flavobacteriia bacterium]